MSGPKDDPKSFLYRARAYLPFRKQAQAEKDARQAKASQKTQGDVLELTQLNKARQEFHQAYYDASSEPDLGQRQAQAENATVKVGEFIIGLSATELNDPDKLKSQILDYLKAEGLSNASSLEDAKDEGMFKASLNIAKEFLELSKKPSVDIQATHNAPIRSAHGREICLAAKTIALEEETKSAITLTSATYDSNDDAKAAIYALVENIDKKGLAKKSVGAQGDNSFEMVDPSGKKSLSVQVKEITAGSAYTAEMTVCNPVKNADLCSTILKSIPEMEVKDFTDARAIAAIIREVGKDLKFSQEAKDKLKDMIIHDAGSWLGTMSKMDRITIKDYLGIKSTESLSSSADQNRGVKFGHKH